LRAVLKNIHLTVLGERSSQIHALVQRKEHGIHCTTISVERLNVTDFNFLQRNIKIVPRQRILISDCKQFDSGTESPQKQYAFEPMLHILSEPFPGFIEWLMHLAGLLTSPLHSMDLPNFSVALDIELPCLREVYSCGYSWSLSLHSLFVLFFNKNQIQGKYR
jgi:hypothetical protein